jgi:hypothetical protein
MSESSDNEPTGPPDLNKPSGEPWPAPDHQLGPPPTPPGAYGAPPIGAPPAGPPPPPQPYGAPPAPGSYGAPAPGRPPPNPYGPPGGGGGGGYPAYPRAVTNTKAIVSLVSGIASMVACPLLGIVGLITGFTARREIRDANGTETGDGLAVGGIVTSLLGLIVIGCIFGSIFAIILLGSNAEMRFSSVGSAIR